MNLIPKEILQSHLQRAEGAEEVTLPVDFFRDLLYQAMPRTWVGLTLEELIEISTPFEGLLPEGWMKLTNAVEAKLKEKNT